MRLQTVLAAHSHAFQLQYLPASPAGTWQQPLLEHQAQLDLQSSTLQFCLLPTKPVQERPCPLPAAVCSLNGSLSTLHCMRGLQCLDCLL